MTRNTKWPNPILQIATAIIGGSFSLLSLWLSYRSAGGFEQTIALLALSVLFLILPVCLYFFYHKYDTTGPTLPSDELGIRCHVRQATKNEVDWIAIQQSSVYKKADAIPRELLQEWYSVNPTGFFVITDQHNKLLGHLDLLPIRPSILAKLREGIICEKDISGNDLYNESERDSITDVWIESLYLDIQDEFICGLNMIDVFRAMPSLIEGMANPLNLRLLYAISAKPKGKSTLLKIGMEIIRAKSSRADKHDLHAGTFEDVFKHVQRLASMRDGRRARSKDGAVRAPSE